MIVSRGQLVEIGGSFRIPEVMAKSGAKLVEVGATNRTHLFDYQSAITPETAMLLRVHTSYFKDVLAAKLDVPAADPGAWLLHANYSEAWASHLCVEFINDAGAWECPRGKDNHGFDCGVYLLALADVLGVKFWPLPSEARPRQKQATTEQANPYTGGRNIFGSQQ